MKPSSTEARDNGRRDAHRTWRRRRRQHQKSLAGFFSLFSPVFFLISCALLLKIDANANNDAAPLKNQKKNR